MKTITIYAQRWQSNGFYPVYKYRRDEDGKWFFGFCKEENGKNVFEEHRVTFDLKSQEWNDNYYLFSLRNNYTVYRTDECFDSDKMYESNITIEEIERMIKGRF